MPNVLTTASTVTCGHPVPPKLGQVIVASTAKLKVAGAPVLLPVGAAAGTIADCGTVVTPGGNKPCTKVVTVGPGPSTKLKVAGSPVLLDTLVLATDGNPPAVPPAAVANQPKLRAL